MNSLYEHSKLNLNLIKLIDSYTGMTGEQLLILEKDIINRYKQKLILLIEDKDYPIALFTSREKAEQYMIKSSIEEIIIIMEKKYTIKSDFQIKEKNKEKNKENDDTDILFQDIISHSSKNYELINIFHLNPNKKIYITHNDDGLIWDDPINHFTNDLQIWKSRNKFEYYQNTLKSKSKEYRKQCIVDVDPEFEYNMENFE